MHPVPLVPLSQANCRSLPGMPAVIALLGPTNTGKTYHAVERLRAHRTGMYEKGRLWPGWQFKIRNLLRKLESNGIIDSGQAFQAEFTPVKFRRD